MVSDLNQQKEKLTELLTELKRLEKSTVRNCLDHASNDGSDEIRYSLLWSNFKSKMDT